jgi:hypothetical protein
MSFVTRSPEYKSSGSLECVKFLAGGNKKEVNEEQGARGFPGSFATRRGACVGKAGAKGDQGRGEPKASERGSEVDETEPSQYSDCCTW